MCVALFVHWLVVCSIILILPFRLFLAAHNCRYFECRLVGDSCSLVSPFFFVSRVSPEMTITKICIKGNSESLNSTANAKQARICVPEIDCICLIAELFPGRSTSITRSSSLMPSHRRDVMNSRNKQIEHADAEELSAASYKIIQSSPLHPSSGRYCSRCWSASRSQTSWTQVSSRHKKTTRLNNPTNPLPNSCI